LDRFFEGQTSNEEEKQLYLFFQQEFLPEELEQYRPIIRYFESGLADELGVQHDPKKQQATKKLSFVKKRLLIWSSIAASFLIILSSTLFIFRNTDAFDPYQGSYIIRNGVRITDLNLIKPELEAAIQKSLVLEHEADRLIERLSEIDDHQEVQIMQQLQEYNQQILDNIHDETIRTEAEKILNTNL
jgi:hypothetical protein